MSKLVIAVLLAGALVLNGSCASNTTQKPDSNPYKAYVWPPPPNDPKVGLIDIIRGRADIEATSGLDKSLQLIRKDSAFDVLNRPIGVAFDPLGRIVVTDNRLKAVIRFDRSNRVMDVMGTTGPSRLASPMGLTIDPDGIIYVADIGHDRVIAIDSSGEFVRSYGKIGELDNPTGVAVSPLKSEIVVADSRAHKLVFFDKLSGKKLRDFGKGGSGPGEFHAPSAVAYDSNGDLFVVDQLNARIQIFDPAGEYVTEFGGRGIAWGQLNRPKGVAIDTTGNIYVTDAIFGNIQIFNPDIELLTFVGRSGTEPGEFSIAGDIAVHDGVIAVVDQLNKRIQVFKLLDAGPARGK